MQNDFTIPFECTCYLEDNTLQLTEGFDYSSLLPTTNLSRIDLTTSEKITLEKACERESECVEKKLKKADEYEQQIKAAGQIMYNPNSQRRDSDLTASDYMFSQTEDDQSDIGLVHGSGNVSPSTPRSKRRSYTCEMCKKKFGRRYRLKEHVSAVHFNKGHACSLCNKVFVYRDTLSRHLQDIHSTKSVGSSTSSSPRSREDSSTCSSQPL